jgi:hypothetical protein
MRKVFWIGALVLLASTAAASAATIVALDGFCNAYAVRNDHGTISVKDTACSEGFGAGFLASIKSEGKTLVVGLQDPANPHTQFVFKFSYPLITGGTWSLYDTTDGVHTVPLVSGNYTLPAAGMHEHTAGVKSATAR